MLPLLDLTHQLALQGLKITILITPKNLEFLTPLLSTHPNSIQTLVLPFPPHPKLPLGVENVKDIGCSSIASFIAVLGKLEGEVIEWFRSHPSPPQAILYDFFLGYTQHWAEKLHIPTTVFFTSGAFFTCHYYRLLKNISEFRKLDVVQIPDIPRSPSFFQDQLPTLFRQYREDDSDWKIINEAMLANPKSRCYIFNTFYALESEYLDQVKKDLGHDRVYSIGPLGAISVSKRVDLDLDVVGYSVLKWLDKCPSESVLYVCFGSQKLLTKPQMESLALGLERSKTRFVWVVKAENSQWVPQEFEERVLDQGLVIKGWAPQVEILNHKAVGGFVSHCGWNSILESVISGVMILAWPMEADQFQNAKLLEEYQGLAIRLCEGEHTVPDSNELARIISESLNGDIPQMENVKLMKQKALEAVQHGGSSSIDLSELVKELSHNVLIKNII